MRYMYGSGAGMTRHSIVQNLLLIDKQITDGGAEIMPFQAVFAWLAARFSL
jgi:hypothetical protein